MVFDVLRSMSTNLKYKNNKPQTELSGVGFGRQIS